MTLALYVSGAGEFPIEMLQLARCYPDGMGDSSIIKSTLTGFNAPPRWEVKLLTDWDLAPHLHEWEEKGCKVRVKEGVV